MLEALCSAVVPVPLMAKFNAKPFLEAINASETRSAKDVVIFEEEIKFS